MPYKDPIKRKENTRKYYLKNRKKIIRYAATWNKINKEARRKIVRRNNRKRAIAKRIWWEKKHFGGYSKEGKICVMCKENNTRKLNIHHRDGNNGRRGKSLNNDPGNLTVLCDSCHPKVHNRWWIKKI